MKTKEQKYDELMIVIRRKYDQMKEGAMLIPNSRNKKGEIVAGLKVPRTESIRLACGILEELMRICTDTPTLNLQLKTTASNTKEQSK